MSSHIDITAFALQDILEGIADGLSDAQRTLRDIAPYDSFGRPNTIYQVPYLEFNLQVTTEFQTVTEDEVAIRSQLKFKPAKLTSGTKSKTEIFSSVSGKFVATVPNEGLPQTVILIKTTEPVIVGANYEIEVEAEVKNTVGEKFTDATVEFNFDADTSNELSPTDIIAAPTFSIAEVSTDVDGLATTVVTIPSTEFDEGKFYVINVNIGTVSKTVSLSEF